MAAEVEIYAFIGGHIETLKERLIQIDNPNEMGKPYTIPIPYFVIRHDNDFLAFDTGMHERCAVDPKDYWGEGLLGVPFVPVMTPDDALDRQLNKLGLVPDKLHGVILSHGHMDHAGGVHLFQDTGVPVFVQQAELDVIKAGAPGYVPGDFGNFDKIRFTPVDGMFDVFNDKTVVAFPFPGHTPGVQGVMVSVDEKRRYLLTSDALDSIEQLDQMLMPWAVWDASKMIQVLHTLRLLRLMGVKVVPSHDIDYWKNRALAPEPLD